MASKRKPASNPKFNYRPPDTMRNETKGTKPTTDPTSIKEILTLTILFVCKKYIFYNTTYKIYIYLGALFLVSLIADFASIPKSFMSRSDNILNQYFVKFSWGWNLLLITPFVVLTSNIYCCGEKDKMVKQHLLRLGVATFFWYIWTNLFNIIEGTFGWCNMKGENFNTKSGCLKGGHYWNGFDISGHSFILIYGSLMLIEESRSILNWDSIKEYLRLENYYRDNNDPNYQTPLKSLTKEQIDLVSVNYDKHTYYIRILFIAVTFLNILWDFMLFSTILYYHVMVEKLIGGVVAVVTWFLTYRLWYPSVYLPRTPGDGLFKYIKSNSKSNTGSVPVRRRTGSIVNGNDIPTFMGRPIYQNQNLGEDTVR